MEGYMEYNGYLTPTALPQRIDGALKIYRKSCDRREIFSKKHLHVTPHADYPRGVSTVSKTLPYGTSMTTARSWCALGSHTACSRR